jgi:hypothetical protein
MLDGTLQRALAEGTLQVVSTGNDMPVIDLRKVCEIYQQCCWLQQRHLPD